MKKLIIVASSIVTLSFGGFLLADNFGSPKPSASTKVISDHGKVDSFASLTELENESPIIVRGKKVGKLSTQVRKSKVDPTLVSGWTESEFLIREVIKNDGNSEKVQVNKKIVVGEMAFEYEGAIHTVNGYQEMKNGDEYLLFLVEQDGLFATRGVTYGKVPLDTKELELYSEESHEESHEEEIHAEELASIFDQARKKYGK
ncbi:hypothetical protein [Cytobacillus oceanisediminis]|uniref:hypothetical protein n=1 Tax=Cytobacillus oceanisediminis TaxID=665099 RepID=UPI001FB3449E|nr:hypothetical protein [Cytobacillus oceanisediminis]UOE58008.1 hypothetical protein IRB79_27470 [Cytobacillus oceanisediminis]